MSDYTLDPDAAEVPDTVALLPTRRVKGGSNGAHPLAEVPVERGPDRASCTSPAVFVAPGSCMARRPAASTWS